MGYGGFTGYVTAASLKAAGASGSLINQFRAAHAGRYRSIHLRRKSVWAGNDTVLLPKDIHCCAQFLIADSTIDDEYTELFFANSIAPGGYVWAFPKGKKLANVGIGIQGAKSRSNEPVRLLKEFMKSRFPNGKIVEMVVGGDPSSGLIESSTADGIMLVGDAAHQTDPITSGGILNAMKAGIIAGEVAAKAISSGDVSKAGLKDYEDRWRAEIGKHIARSYEYKEFFFGNEAMSRAAQQFLEIQGIELLKGDV